ncbi:hypothetical protein V2J09_003619 [Rumex salicifolius]
MKRKDALFTFPTHQRPDTSPTGRRRESLTPFYLRFARNLFLRRGILENCIWRGDWGRKGADSEIANSG